MPLPGAKYRVKQTAKGPVRLAFVKGVVREAKNLKTGDTKMIAPKRGKK